jgi:hypothetical protein
LQTKGPNKLRASTIPSKRKKNKMVESTKEDLLSFKKEKLCKGNI